MFTAVSVTVCTAHRLLIRMRICRRCTRQCTLIQESATRLLSIHTSSFILSQEPPSDRLFGENLSFYLCLSSRKLLFLSEKTVFIHTRISSNEKPAAGQLRASRRPSCAPRGAKTGFPHAVVGRGAPTGRRPTAPVGVFCMVVPKTSMSAIGSDPFRWRAGRPR